MERSLAENAMPDAGLCPKCSYDTRGVSGGYCPECGTLLSAFAKIRRRQRVGFRRAVQVAFLVSLLPLVGPGIAHAVTVLIRFSIGRWPNYGETDTFLLAPGYGSFLSKIPLIEFLSLFFAAPFALCITLSLLALGIVKRRCELRVLVIMLASLLMIALGCVLAFDPWRVTYWFFD